MPRQPDFLPPPGLRIQPEAGRTEPRLWVRRLVLWSEPGVVLREITLRPGLNFVWSPDPAEHADVDGGDSALAHGGGKTLFCRLLRYCLGEDRFASDDQRDGVVRAFPDGLVGAEVMLDGTCWAILRPMGTSRKHVAIRNGNLDNASLDAVAQNGVAPFLETVENLVLSKDVVSLIPGDRALHAWLVALAWLARDQECRFDRVLDWRSPDSDSDSPARGLSAIKILDALRALIGAIVPEEQKLRDEISEMEVEHQKSIQESAQRRASTDRMRFQLVTDLGLRDHELLPGLLGVEPMRQAARAELARMTMVSDSTNVADFTALRARDEQAWSQSENLAKRLAEFDARLPEIERLISRIKGELPALSFSTFKSENAVCPVCEVPIDRALAEGCKLSHKLPDAVEIRARWEKHEQDLKRESDRLQDDKEGKKRISTELDSARRHAGECREQLRAAEKARDAREDTWYRARRRIDDVDRLDELLVAQERADLNAADLIQKIDKKRERVGAHRDAQADVFRRLSQFFDAIIRELVGPTAEGRVTLGGLGLRLSVQLGGERSTAAIESLKVVAFDLAVMCMSIEGGTHLPAFLVHDSPREADLGLSVYHRLFRLARRLEEFGDQPLFQYIITTTTRPPDELMGQPWLRETLRGAPAHERLLRRDL